MTAKSMMPQDEKDYCAARLAEISNALYDSSTNQTDDKIKQQLINDEELVIQENSDDYLTQKKIKEREMIEKEEIKVKEKKPKKSKTKRKKQSVVGIWNSIIKQRKNN